MTKPLIFTVKTGTEWIMRIGNRLMATEKQTLGVDTILIAQVRVALNL